MTDSVEIHHTIGRRIRAARTARGLTLAQLGGNDLSRSYLSLVERGRSRISVRALAIVARRLEVPMSYFLDERPNLQLAESPTKVDHVEAAIAYSLLLRQRGDTEQALNYALWAAQRPIESAQDST